MSIIAEHGQILLILACLFGVFMAWGVGANDVANAMGTSVGSKALTIKQAIIIAMIFEFLGAYLAGGEVTATVRKGIIDPAIMAGTPELLVYGMMSALLAAGTWLLIASILGWPVSTTHSIVGAIVGFAAVGISVDAVAWAKVGKIVASWVVSPLLAGTIAFGLFRSVQVLILNTDNPYANAKKSIRAAMDMATETHFLSVLNHQHIIKMRAVGEIDMFDKNYFIVLDRLYDTLDERIEDWQEELKNSTTCLAMFRRGSKTKKKRLFAERLTVARNIASAMQHLHDLNVIYRDMKPENIGFDVKNVVKVFDFGLAKELHSEDKLANDTYRLTGNTGSIRYMAPEVANKRTYNFSVDVYSFGIMLWETVAMQIPFKFFNQAMIREMVCNFGQRPDIDDDWPEDLQNLIKSCWSDSFKKRPDFAEVIRVLDSEIAKVETELSSSSSSKK